MFYLLCLYLTLPTSFIFISLGRLLITDSHSTLSFGKFFNDDGGDDDVDVFCSGCFDSGGNALLFAHDGDHGDGDEPQGLAVDDGDHDGRDANAHDGFDVHGGQLFYEPRRVEALHSAKHIR